MTAIFPEARISPPDVAGPCRGCDYLRVVRKVGEAVIKTLERHELESTVSAQAEEQAFMRLVDELRPDWGPECAECAREART